VNSSVVVASVEADVMLDILERVEKVSLLSAYVSCREPSSTNS